MSDADAADLYRQLIILPLLVVSALAVVLAVLQVLAINGRPILPERFARMAGWLVFGLLVGLATQLTPDALTWIVAGGLAAGTASMVVVIVLIGVGIFMLLPVLTELAGGGR